MASIIQGDLSNYWFLIFHHDITKGNFKDENEAKFCPRHSGKFSVLSRLDELMKYDEYFEFLLTYPQFDGYIHWRQKENPTKTYGPIECDFIDDTWKSEFTFKGLSLSDFGSSFLEGQYDSKNLWFYAIGQYGGSRIAGPWWSINDKNITEVNLYLKVFDTKQISKLFSFFTFKHSSIQPKIFLSFFFVTFS